VFNCLMAGEIREHRVAGDRLEWGDLVSKAQLYDIYVSSIRNRYEQPVKEVHFWRALRGCEGLLLDEKQKREGDSRIRCVQLADLTDARKGFEVAAGMSIDWPDAGEVDPLDPANWDDE